MKLVTKTLAVFLMMFSVAKAQSTVNVTFNFDATQLVTNCWIEDGGKLALSGSMNGWNGTGTDAFTKGTGNNYSLVKALGKKAAGDTTYNFKLTSFATATSTVAWEGDPNRSLTLSPTSADQAVTLGAWQGTVSNLCAPTDNVEVVFQVNMFVQRIAGNFDGATDDIRLAGDFTGWGATDSKKLNASLTPDVFEAVHQFTGIKLGVPQQKFKFIIVKNGNIGWEGGGDKTFTLPTTGLSDPDGNGFKNYTWTSTPGQVHYFDGVDETQVFTAARECYLELNARPAYYHLADSLKLPASIPAGGTGPTSIAGFFVNGPLGEATGDAKGTWPWGTGPNELGTLTTRQLKDDGLNGDTVAGDSIFTMKYSFAAGKLRKYVGKFSVNGFDNEAAGQADDTIVFPDAASCRMRSVFGAWGPVMSGKMGDDIPSSTAAQAGPFDPYMNITHAIIPGATAAPFYTSTVQVVRRGGNVDGIRTDVEQTSTEIPTAVALGKAFPNPFNTASTFEYQLAQDEKVSIKVYDMMGRVVATLVDGEVQTAGTYRATLNAEGLASGMYIYRLETASEQLSGKMMIVK